jgi:hypothetical protein
LMALPTSCWITTRCNLVISTKIIEAEPLHHPQIERATLLLPTGLTNRLGDVDNHECLFFIACQPSLLESSILAYLTSPEGGELLLWRPESIRPSRTSLFEGTQYLCNSERWRCCLVAFCSSHRSTSPSPSWGGWRWGS